MGISPGGAKAPREWLRKRPVTPTRRGGGEILWGVQETEWWPGTESNRRHEDFQSSFMVSKAIRSQSCYGAMRWVAMYA